MSKTERRQSRILALQVFFCYEQQGFESSIEDVFERVVSLSDVEKTTEEYIQEQENGEIKKILQTAADSPSTLNENVKNYALEIVKFAAQNLRATDVILSKYAHSWSFERMSAMDRNLLRIAVAELDEKFAVPPPVVINEAIEIAKIFGTDDSAKFVNAILDKIKYEILTKNK
ncbi:MAG: transcription antitermination factor NusB [Chitinispirillales bacterium]|nr:transcription antitermination factor NusB [Chitinispirillales bacterium]